MGKQMLTPNPGVRSPFHTGGGGGGGGGGSKGAGAGPATMQVFDAASYTVPWPHSAAVATPGRSNVPSASAVSVAATTVAKHLIMPIIAGPPIGSCPILLRQKRTSLPAPFVTF